MTLNGENIYLRTPILSDAPKLMEWENSQESIEVSYHDGGFLINEIEEYIKNTRDVYLDKQLRFLICKESEAIGTIDLYDVDLDGGIAFIGILLADKLDRGQGLGHEALQLLSDYCLNILNICELRADIDESNIVSVAFFKRCGFIPLGTKGAILKMKLELTKGK